MSPRVVDPVARRQAVAEAVFRVVARDGVEGTSMRKVALEVILSVGSIRHYFDTHDDMMLFAFEALNESIRNRMCARVAGLSSAEPRSAESVLAEVLPLDERRRDEAVLGLAFVMAARTRPLLMPQSDRYYESLRSFCEKVLILMRGSGDIAAALDVALETERLASLLEGLAVNGVLYPDRMAPELMLSLLRRHLHSLR